MKKPIVAIVYDFDKTLCSEDMQNYSFIPALGMTPEEFWGATSAFSEKTNVERILSYMYMMIKLAKDKGINLTKEYLKGLGKDIKFYPGVLTWFKRINEYGESLGIQVEHYLVSSGTKEIIDGCAIADQFKAIYGCEFLFGEDGLPIWPKLTINYTAKTQFIYRITKGVLDVTDDSNVNKRINTKRVPFQNIVYLGDGMTDIPCMALVKESGGKSIAIYTKDSKDKAMELYNENRVNFICKADYSSNSQLEKVIKLVINSVAITNELTTVETKLSEHK
ncbi:MAG: haloacid dehalogenase-like hydrolase [Erysipelotrichaceae bacterium]|nr:haloacid dehalogenase-like hydrolase [Erysipelotrichaceae bacterium]